MFQFTKIRKLSINNYESNDRNMVPKNQEILIGKLMFDNKIRYFDKKRFQKLVDRYLKWKKFAKSSNDNIFYDELEFNHKYTFVGKIIGFRKKRYRTRNFSKKFKRVVLLKLIREEQTGNRLHKNAEVNYTKAFVGIDGRHIGSYIRLNATIKEKEFIRNKKMLYKLKNPSMITTSKKPI